MNSGRSVPVPARALALGLASVIAAAPALAQAPDSLPFGTGERLEFIVHSSRAGTVGHAVMAVTGPVDVRGTEALVASFSTHVRIAFFSGGDDSRSWIDPRTMSSLRFARSEHRPFGSSHDSVEIYPAQRFWGALGGESGTTPTSDPLDELSFIYFLRTIPFGADSVYSFDRFYDQRRTPTTVRVLKRDTVTTPIGTFPTVVVEMRSIDGGDFKGVSVLRIWISESRCRLPVRIETPMAMLGTGTLTLESAVTPTCPPVNPPSATGRVRSR